MAFFLIWHLMKSQRAGVWRIVDTQTTRFCALAMVAPGRLKEYARTTQHLVSIMFWTCDLVSIKPLSALDLYWSQCLYWESLSLETFD